MPALGYSHLQGVLGLPNLPLAHASSLGPRMERTELSDFRVTERYTASYDPGPDLLDHVVFALRYDGVDLTVLHQVFKKIPVDQVENYIRQRPTGKYARMVGFLYEFLTGLTLEVICGGTYVQLLSPDSYYTGKETRSGKWHVVNNLLGSSRFCPIIRKNATILSKLYFPWEERIQGVLHQVSAADYQRAVDYLYLKETKSSYAIERETAERGRQQRFVDALHQAGQREISSVLSESGLTALQNVIVDPRFAATGFRDQQNYVGQTMPGFTQRIHYICPPPQVVRELMEGFLQVGTESKALPPIVRAAMLAFAFVFIHPFEDGNGRLHRFLLHDVLARGFMESGVILPVSASILMHPQNYDRCLEQFSRKVQIVAEYDLDPRGVLTVGNPDELSGIYRFPDLTTQVEYFLDVLEDTVSQQLPNELRILRSFDRARKGIQDVVDLPDRRLDLLLGFLHGNHGKLSKAKRPQFPELTDQEIAQMEQAFAEAFSREDA